ncbi:MAG: glycoside-pentoside-hexuronide (GPH):cation symporter [Candidatus Enterosoma sp.]|nr:glycoside-pentoside-hexuronide (GPH):cation symporter [bacterium]MDY5547926.1 glycoside-pentoside-hexuronide (GPH):cation symporter [Candidatus Enterosoma sp.]
MYPLGTIGRDMIYALFNSFILTYILLTRQLDNAQLAAVTAIMIGARIFDAVNDPIMGFIIEKTRTRWGKFKPWLLAGILSTAGVIITIFNTTLQGWGFIALFGVIYFLYSITYTMSDISYWGMIPSLSSSPDTRNQFTSRAVLFAGIGGTLAGMLIPMFTVGKSSLTGSTQSSYGIISIIIAALAILFICFTLFGVKESKEAMEVKKDVKKTSTKDILRTIVKNKPLLWIIIAFIFQQIGNSLAAGGIASTYIYFQYGYEGGYYSLFSTIGVAATAILMIFYPMISRKINRKPLMTIMLFVALFGYLLMGLTALSFLNSNMVGFWILTIGYMLSNFGQYGFYLVMMISIMNTVEYNEYISGEREEAIITSVRPFVTKMTSAIVVGLTSLTYVIFHVVENTNRISELEQQATTGVIDEATKLTGINAVISSIDNGQKLGLLFAMILLPLICMLISYFVYQKKYPLDEKEYDRICSEIEKRKEVQDTPEQVSE